MDGPHRTTSLPTTGSTPDPVRFVQLGPEIELHSGIHQCIIDSPPEGFEYLIGHGRHHFRHLPDTRWNPLRHQSVDEWIEFDPPDAFSPSATVPSAAAAPATATPATASSQGTRSHVVHTSKVPADDGVPWVADCDCLMATLLLGRDFVMGHGAESGPRLDEELSRLRFALMSRRYLSPACFGVLFHTETMRSVFLDAVAEDPDFTSAERERFDAKCGVMLPMSEPPPTPDPAGLKWREPGEPCRIVYSGRAGAMKGQDVAAAVFNELIRRMPDRVALTWIGQSPPEGLAAEVEVLPTLQRTDYLDLIGSSHVYFCPTTQESYGMAMVEAAGHSCVVVTGEGPLMSHIGELFTHDHDAVVIESAATDIRVSTYLAELEDLVIDPTRCERLARGGRMRVARGHRVQRRQLSQLYDQMFRSTPASTRPSASEAAADCRSPKLPLDTSTISTAILGAAHSKAGGGEARNFAIRDRSLLTPDMAEAIRSSNEPSTGAHGTGRVRGRARHDPDPRPGVGTASR